MKETEVNGFQVLSDGEKVWVNGPDGVAAARLSKVGRDVHAPFASGGHCEDCGPNPVSPSRAWEVFVQSVELHHGIVVPEQHRPGWAS